LGRPDLTPETSRIAGAPAPVRRPPETTWAPRGRSLGARGWRRPRVGAPSGCSGLTGRGTCRSAPAGSPAATFLA
jgi:hypothetical protein